MTGPSRLGKAARDLKMKMSESRAEISLRAAEALKAVLSEVSTLKLKEIRCESVARGSKTGLVARVDVLGHSHTLACEVKTNADPRNLRDLLREVQESAALVAGNATPVLIAPYLSPEAQALCNESNAAFLDLEGNARLALGEVFIGKRSLRHRKSVSSECIDERALAAVH
jgi:hypothetical protein